MDSAAHHQQGEKQHREYGGEWAESFHKLSDGELLSGRCAVQEDLLLPRAHSQRLYASFGGYLTGCCQKLIRICFAAA